MAPFELNGLLIPFLPMSHSIFSRIIRGNVPGSFIYRDDLVSVFLDIQAVNPGHCLVVPNKPQSV